MSRQTRADAEFAKTISDLEHDRDIEFPIKTLNLFLLEYSKKEIDKEDFKNGIQLILNKHPEEFNNFREEMRKHNLTLARKNNYMENSPQYTIRPFQKPTRKISLKPKLKAGSSSKSNTKLKLGLRSKSKKG